MRILLWHVHGSWATAFVQGPHSYVMPVNDRRDADGRGRAKTWDWPASVVEMAAGQIRDVDLDLVLLQRPHELELAEKLTGRRPGVDLPAVYVEHNTPGGEVPYTRHPLADRTDVPIVHVTPFNRLMWDSGVAKTHVVQHGICDPGELYTGELARAATVMNEPGRRTRAVGADLVPRLASAVPVDVFGMGTAVLAGRETDVRAYDLPQAQMHAELARRRVYVHTARWTSLGLSLIEAMQLGMPVVALGTTEVPAAIPPDAGRVINDLDELATTVRGLVDDPAQARELGRRGRAHALRAFGLDRFLTDWDSMLASTAAQ
jgi:glycosyltransferase involved in cell wall biosynthesis